jgi:hypothetical protein
VRLQRLILTFGSEGLEIRTLYRSEAGPNPGTKARGRVVADLARSGLRGAPMPPVDWSRRFTYVSTGTNEDGKPIVQAQPKAPPR